MDCDGNRNILIVNEDTVFIYGCVFGQNLFENTGKIVLINITIQSFKSENELELSLVKWDSVKEKFMPRLDRNGLTRYSITRIWNKKDQYQLGHIFEYKNEQAMKDCLPIWNDIEREFKDKIPNIAVGYRGILLDQYESKT
jgi:hypothetical protein